MPSFFRLHYFIVFIIIVQLFLTSGGAVYKVGPYNALAEDSSATSVAASNAAIYMIQASTYTASPSAPALSWSCEDLIYQSVYSEITRMLYGPSIAIVHLSFAMDVDYTKPCGIKRVILCC